MALSCSKGYLAGYSEAGRFVDRIGPCLEKGTAGKATSQFGEEVVIHSAYVRHS
jgi:hypothetical protein